MCHTHPGPYNCNYYSTKARAIHWEHLTTIIRFMLWHFHRPLCFKIEFPHSSDAMIVGNSLRKTGNGILEIIQQNLDGNSIFYFSEAAEGSCELELPFCRKSLNKSV